MATKIGIVGCGHILRLVYAPLLADWGVEVVALCDPAVHRATEVGATFFPAARVYDDIRRLLGEERLDAVLILTSEHATARLGQLALERNLSVYLEKPPAMSTKELAVLQAAEFRSHGSAYTAFNRRHLSIFQDLGIPAHALHQVTGTLARKNRAAHLFPATAVHLIDSVQYYSGLRLIVRRITWESQPVCRWVFSGALANGATVTLCFFPDVDREEEVIWFETADEKWKLRFPGPDPARIEPRASLTRQRSVGPPEETHCNERHPLDATGYAPCLREFLDRLERGTLPSSVHRLDSCSPIMDSLEQMHRSHGSKMIQSATVEPGTAEISSFPGS